MGVVLLMASRPRVLVLDCGGVTNPDCGEGNDDVAAAMGVSPEAARKGHKAAWACARADPTFVDYWRHAFETAGVPISEQTPERAAACEAALAPALRTTYAASVRAALRAKAAGTIVGIISNHLVATPLFDYCADGAGLRTLVSDPTLIVVSQAVGHSKPNEEIYRLFFERLRHVDATVQPEHLLFVDDKDKNVEAAVALGWQGLVYDARLASERTLADELVAKGMALADD